jgi:excisionase family DNA binding protein
VTPTPAAASLDLEEAAAFLGLHPDTLRERAAAGTIPGAKIGKEWRFLDIDLADYLRGQYRTIECQSTSAAKSGGSRYVTAAEELDALLEPPTGKRPSESTTSLKLVSGNRSEAGTRSPTRSSRGRRRSRAAGAN